MKFPKFHLFSVLLGVVALLMLTNVESVEVKHHEQGVACRGGRWRHPPWMSPPNADNAGNGGGAGGGAAGAGGASPTSGGNINGGATGQQG